MKKNIELSSHQYYRLIKIEFCKSSLTILFLSIFSYFMLPLSTEVDYLVFFGFGFFCFINSISHFFSAFKKFIYNINFDEENNLITINYFDFFKDKTVYLNISETSFSIYYNFVDSMGDVKVLDIKSNKVRFKLSIPKKIQKDYEILINAFIDLKKYGAKQIKVG